MTATKTTEQLRYLTADGKLGCMDWDGPHTTTAIAEALADVDIVVADLLWPDEPIDGLGREYGCRVSRWNPGGSGPEAVAAYAAVGLTLDDPLPDASIKDRMAAAHAGPKLHQAKITLSDLPLPPGTTRTHWITQHPRDDYDDRGRLDNYDELGMVLRTTTGLEVYWTGEGPIRSLPRDWRDKAVYCDVDAMMETIQQLADKIQSTSDAGEFAFIAVRFGDKTHDCMRHDTPDETTLRLSVEESRVRLMQPGVGAIDWPVAVDVVIGGAGIYLRYYGCDPDGVIIYRGGNVKLSVLNT